MIKDSASSPHEEVNTVSQLADLVVDGHSTVHSDDLVLIILMLNTAKDCRYLFQLNI